VIKKRNILHQTMGLTVKLLQSVHEVVTSCTWSCYSLYMKLLQSVHEVVTSCTWSCYSLYMKLLQSVHEVATVCAWSCYSLYMKLLQYVHEVATGCTWSCYRLYTIQPKLTIGAVLSVATATWCHAVQKDSLSLYWYLYHYNCVSVIGCLQKQLREGGEGTFTLTLWTLRHIHRIFLIVNSLITWKHVFS